MKYKAGDRVRIRSKEWYESHKNKFGKIWTVCLSGEGTIYFDQDNAKYCGKEVTIFSVEPDNYVLRGIPYEWTDEMIEGLVEEESIPNKIEEAKTYWDNIKDAWICPEGYIFKDENGNIINTTKIVLEKKKKEYPKTYEECCKVLEIEGNSLLINTKNITDYERDLSNLIGQLHRLIICRDAYWKIAGEEMGLGKPWEPDLLDDNQDKFALANWDNTIENSDYAINKNYILTLPTEEMRDAFYKNFKSEIEICKELL